MSEDWTKYARGKGGGPKRVTVTVPTNIQNAIETFKSAYPDEQFTDAAVIQTMLEAGLKHWYTTTQVEKDNQDGVE